MCMNGKTFKWNRLAVMLAVIVCSMQVMVAQEIKVVAPEIGGFEYDAMPDVTYDEIADRMACLENTIPLVFNDRVKSFVDYFTIKNRDYTVEVLNRKER